MKPITQTLYARRGDHPFYPVITAHSGCEGTPDNSLEHIRTALSCGAEMFEIDINRSESDGVLYLTHNPRESYASCPTLAQCFELTAAHPTMCINCDVKSFGLTEPVIALAKQYGMESRILFTGSVSPEELPLLNASQSDWWLSLWASDHEEDDLAGACKTYRTLDNLYRIINLDQCMINDRVIRTMEETGHTLSVWTVNNETALRRFMGTGVIANITTRIPKLALEIRREIYGI